ncbi:sensor histidine kinase [Nonomuraea sp. KC401]|uniref:sensor histidine kinase n=1 Tax=unclassified Nonomuraea TaxID=2593643 RepID=UPI0010FF3A47|nr:MULTISPECIES: sensor histidine kinase [unclassified Nonomuraea]NBE96871.1 sensor histidine kinase [Nonomuraea sp. K271]TLF66465.1 sensor histidine kinase [Nonomuraea sp. KC401]
MTTEDVSRLDQWERLLQRLLTTVPYVLLAVSMALSLLTDDRPGTYHLVTLGLSVLAAAWVWLMPRRHPVVYVTGLVILIAMLCSRGLWFGSFFAFTGYLHSWHLLKGKWKFAGVAATAVISITAFSGGLPEPTLPAIATHVVFTAAIVAGVSLFSFVGEVTAERSAERERMVTRLEEAMRENAGLHAQLLLQAREAGVLDERQRMAREIHDTLAQGLAGIITQLQAAVQTEADARAWRRHLDHAMGLARESLTEARRSVHAVQPGPLACAPLPAALAEIAARWSELNAVRVEVSTTGTARPLNPEVEATLLRVAQEALANIAKHAGATRAWLTLSYMEDVVSLDVRDDGAGFDQARALAGGGFGLASMRERVGCLAGAFEIESEPGAGTAVSATVPAITALATTPEESRSA